MASCLTRTQKPIFNFIGSSQGMHLKFLLQQYKTQNEHMFLKALQSVLIS